MSVEFKDNSIIIKKALEDTAINFLQEASGEFISQVQKRVRIDTGQLKNSFRYDISQDELKSTLGSPLENAIWEELGTGEYALGGNGRKGGWKYVDAKGQGHFTRGKKPNRAFFNTYKSLKSRIIKMAEQIFKEGMK